MLSGNEKSRFEKGLERIVTYITAGTVIVAAIVHIATFLPDVYSRIFQDHDVKLLGFYNRSRLIVSNRGDYDYFVSHLSYKHQFEEVYKVKKIAEEMLPGQLKTMCLDYYRSEPGDDSETQLALATAQCEKRLSAARKRQERLQDGKGAKDPWVPGEKNRSLGELLSRDETREFTLGPSRWDSCPSLSEVSKEVLDRALALWAVSYKTLPGECLEANYYYTQDRNFLDKTRKSPEFSNSLIPSEAYLHVYSTNAEDHAEQIALPFSRDTIVSELRYRNTEFCTKQLRKIVGFDAAPGVPEGKDCFNIKK